MNLDIVTFEQAKALKELGFPQEYISSNQKIYNRKGELTTQDTTFWSYGHEADAPSLELAAKWLREEKDFGIFPHRVTSITGGRCSSLFKLQIVLPHSFYETDPDGMNSLLGVIDVFETYEVALSAGIDIAINVLKKV